MKQHIFSRGLNVSLLRILNKHLKTKTAYLIICAILMSCSAGNSESTSSTGQNPIIGTWQLLTGTLIEKGDTTVTDYTKNISFIKIINDTHFAFLQHDTNKGKDSATTFVAGGGSYSLKDSLYIEHLQYCSAREWEGNDFNFTISIKNDTLIQYGIEKVESAGVNRINIEKYVRVKS
jgi:hypothetical protein